MNLDIPSPPFWDTFGTSLLIGGIAILIFLILATVFAVIGNLVIFKADDLYAETAASGAKLEEDASGFRLFKKLETLHEYLIFMAAGFLFLLLITASLTIMSCFFQYFGEAQENLTDKVLSEVNSTYEVDITRQQAAILSTDEDGDYYLYNMVLVSDSDGIHARKVAIRNEEGSFELVYYEGRTEVSKLKEVNKR